MEWNRQGSDGKSKSSLYDQNCRLIASRRYLDSIILKGGPFTDPDSDLGQGTISRLEAAKVLSVSILRSLMELSTDLFLE